ncbi:MAG: Nif11 family protein [Lachnospiraceae bacterium]|nr:Nif11 family protein [Lachnospiraceae bacterium]
MGINKNGLTAEQIRKAMKCKDAAELMELAKSEGFEITKEEAEAYLEELSDFELDKENLDKIAGGEPYYKPEPRPNRRT